MNVFSRTPRLSRNPACLFALVLGLAVSAQSLHGMETLRKSPSRSSDGGAKPESPKKPHGTPVVLVENGRPTGPIVLSEGAPLFVKLAAKELANTIGKMSGGHPDIVEGWPDPVPDSAIWVGSQEGLAQLFPDLDLNFQHPEEILIATRGKHLILAGRDRWDPENSVVPASGFQFGGRDAEGFQQEYGTVNAVYTFLQDTLGVRWLWPDASGEVIPESPTIALEQMEFRYHPKIRQRHSIFALSALWRRGGSPSSPRADWTRRNRLQLDSLVAPTAGHGFSDWWKRFHKDHPEYFALQPDGTRSAFPSAERVKICESNPAVWDQWLADVEETLRINPHRTVFSAAANDSYASGHCVCEQCAAWDHPDGELRKFVYRGGVRRMRPALSDRTVTFANTLARKLRERFPDKDYMVLILAYGFSRTPPIGVVPDDNVLVAGVANVLSNPDMVDANSPVGSTHWQQLEGWQKITRNFIWRPNVGDPAGWRSGGPPDVTGMTRTFQSVASGNCIGINIDQIWFYWGSQAPLLHSMARIAWDPSLDPDTVLRDFYEKGFGPAADEVEAYWKLLGQAHKQIIQSENKWNAGFTPELLTRAEELLDRAQTKTEGTDYARRVDFVRAGLEFLQLRTESLALFSKGRNSSEEGAQVLKQIRTNWKRLEELLEKYPSVVNRNAVTIRPEEGQLSFMHPGRLERELREKAETNKNSTPEPAPPAENDLDLF